MKIEEYQAKASKFKEEYQELCRKHGMELGYHLESDAHGLIDYATIECIDRGSHRRLKFDSLKEAKKILTVCYNNY